MGLTTVERRGEILRRLAAKGYVGARELADSLSVDASTIRRDLGRLARGGYLQRTHGGARAEGAGDVPYSAKRHQNLRAKRAIAQFAAGMVDENAVVLFDSGSTTFEVARATASRADPLTVITNDLRIASLFADQSLHRLLVTGGEMMEGVYTLVSEEAVSYLRGLRVDVAFLGADAIAGDEVTNTNTKEIGLKRVMIDVATRRVLVADSSKFGHRALAHVVKLNVFEAIVTEDKLDPAWSERLADTLHLVHVDGGKNRPSPKE